MLYACCTGPLVISSNILALDYLWPVYSDPADTGVSSGQNSYLYYSDALWTSPDRWKLYTALISGSAASLLYAWSSYDVYTAGCNDRETAEADGRSLLETLLIPWSPEKPAEF